MKKSMNKLIVCILLPVCLLALSSSYAVHLSKHIIKPADRASSGIKHTGKKSEKWCRKNKEKCDTAAEGLDAAAESG